MAVCESPNVPHDWLLIPRTLCFWHGCMLDAHHLASGHCHGFVAFVRCAWKECARRRAAYGAEAAAHGQPRGQWLECEALVPPASAREHVGSSKQTLLPAKHSTQTRTRKNTRTHGHTHARTRTYMHTNTHTYFKSLISGFSAPDAYVYIYIYIYIYNIYINRLTRTCKYKYTKKHVQYIWKYRAIFVQDAPRTLPARI